MISENIGFSILPKPIAKKIDQDLIKAIPIDNPSFPWNLGFISKKEKHASLEVREFIQYISADLPPNYEKKEYIKLVICISRMIKTEL